MMESRQPTLDLTLLQTFAAVVDAGGFTAAGQRLSYSQSTVSMQMRRLEEQVGKELVRRVGRRVELTAEGERLLEHARRLLRANEQAWQDLRETRVQGTVRLGIPDDYAFFLPETLGYFGERFPEAELEVRCAISEVLVREVHANRLDLAVVTRQANSPGGEVLRREPLVWAGAPDHAAHERNPLPLALYPQGICTFRERSLEALRTQGRAWRVAYTSQSLSGLRSAVRAGLAITVLTPSMLTPDLRQLGPEHGLPMLPSIEIALHRPPGRPTEPARQMAALIQENLSNLRPAPGVEGAAQAVEGD